MGLLSVGSVYWHLLHWRDTSRGFIVSRLCTGIYFTGGTLLVGSSSVGSVYWDLLH